MGILNQIFGTSSNKYSQKENTLSREDIKKLVSQAKVGSLSQKEEVLIEDAIDKRRRGDGKIALSHINEALRGLENKHTISEFDRKGVMRVFEEHFNK